jgi:hypothetical protein
MGRRRAFAIFRWPAKPAAGTNDGIGNMNYIFHIEINALQEV